MDEKPITPSEALVKHLVEKSFLSLWSYANPQGKTKSAEQCDVPSATAILDRFLQHSEIIAITGKSYRLKDRACRK